MKKLNSLRESGAIKGSSNVPMDERPLVDRSNLGPFVRGYLKAMLSNWPFHDVEDIDEASLQQSIRDCVGFYWRNRLIIEICWNDPFGEYSELQTGSDFWKSRNNEYAFINRQENTDVFEESIWDKLDESARMGWGPVEITEVSTGQLRILFERDWYTL